MKELSLQNTLVMGKILNPPLKVDKIPEGTQTLAIIVEDEGSAQRDVGLIFAGQKAEHYEIATYGGLVQLAKTLGYNEASNVMSQTLSEEKETDALLTQIAEGNINYLASREPQEA